MASLAVFVWHVDALRLVVIGIVLVFSVLVAVTGWWSQRK